MQRMCISFSLDSYLSCSCRRGWDKDKETPYRENVLLQDCLFLMMNVFEFVSCSLSLRRMRPNSFNCRSLWMKYPHERLYSLSVLSCVCCRRVSLAMRCENFHTFLPDTEIKMMMKNSKRKKRPRGPWKVDISHDSRETREKFFDTRCCFLLHLLLLLHGQSPCCFLDMRKGWNMTWEKKGEGRITWKCIQCLQTFFPFSFLGPIRVLFLSFFLFGS